MSNISFKTKLQKLINQYSMENDSNTPDHILAGYIENCLHAFNEATQQRETWYGRDARPSVTITSHPSGSEKDCSA